ncbi:MAG: hypothetical protein RI907_1337, partial [Pseudomonadota bacterium]
MTRARLFQFALLWLIVSVMVWLTTIWRWQNQGSDVSMADIALQLLLLPLALAAVLAGALWGVSQVRKQAAQPITPKVASGQPAPEPRPALAASPVATNPALASAVVLSEHVALLVGHEPDQAREVLIAATARPGLDPELQDFDGMPVFSGRHPDLDVDSWLEQA